MRFPLKPVALVMSFSQVFQNLIELLPAAFEHQVAQILSYAIPVGRDNHHSKPVNIVKLPCLGFGRSSHPSKFVVHSEIILDRDCSVGLSLFSIATPSLDSTA